MTPVKSSDRSAPSPSIGEDKSSTNSSRSFVRFSLSALVGITGTFFARQASAESKKFSAAEVGHSALEGLKAAQFPSLCTPYREALSKGSSSDTSAFQQLMMTPSLDKSEPFCIVLNSFYRSVNNTLEKKEAITREDMKTVVGLAHAANTMGQRVFNSVSAEVVATLKTFNDRQKNMTPEAAELLNDTLTALSPRKKNST